MYFTEEEKKQYDYERHVHGTVSWVAIKLSHRMLPPLLSISIWKCENKYNALVCCTLSLFHFNARAPLSSQHFDRTHIENNNNNKHSTEKIVHSVFEFKNERKLCT